MDLNEKQNPLMVVLCLQLFQPFSCGQEQVKSRSIRRGQETKLETKCTPPTTLLVQLFSIKCAHVYKSALQLKLTANTK